MPSELHKSLLLPPAYLPTLPSNSSPNCIHSSICPPPDGKERRETTRGDPEPEIRFRRTVGHGREQRRECGYHGVYDLLVEAVVGIEREKEYESRRVAILRGRGSLPASEEAIVPLPASDYIRLLFSPS